MKQPYEAGIFTGTVLLFIGGFLALSIATAPDYANSPFEDLPSFVMVREMRAGPALATFELVWEHERRWRETLIESNAPVPSSVPDEDAPAFRDIGRSQGAWDGLVFSTTRDLRQETPQQAGVFIPGVWFRPAELLLNKAAYRGSEIIDDGREVTLRVTDSFGTEEWVADKATGIPVAYRTISPSGAVTSESIATSIVLESGEVVR